MNSDRHILDDDELIDLGETRKIMGEISISSAYEDPELMALKISMTPPGRRTRMVRFIQREVRALRDACGSQRRRDPGGGRGPCRAAPRPATAARNRITRPACDSQT